MDAFSRPRPLSKPTVSRLDPFGRLVRATPNRPAKPVPPVPPYNWRTREQKLDPRTESDSAYRAAWGIAGRRPYGTGLRAAFYEFLPDAPRHTRPDIDGCKHYVRQIIETLERNCWTQRERDRLNMLRKIWTRRAEGLDSRYITHGNSPGRGLAAGLWKNAPSRGVRKIFDEMQTAIAESDARYYANAGIKVSRPAPRSAKYVVDAKFPFGRFNPDYKA
jgi:hypothetical protein